MQHPTAHHPITTDNLSWQEQFLIRLDEIVGLLDSIESRLTGCEEDREDECQVSACEGYSTTDTGHLDTPNMSSDSNPPSPNAEEQPQ